MTEMRKTFLLAGVAALMAAAGPVVAGWDGMAAIVHVAKTLDGDLSNGE